MRRKIHLVSWKEVCLSKFQGGLGVRNLREVNDCLLLKWWWRYGREENALWKKCCAVNMEGLVADGVLSQ